MAGELLGTMLFALAVGIAAFFAPCSYALLPGYVGYFVAATGDETAPLGGVAVRGLAAAIGAVATLLILSAAALLAGETLARTIPVLEYAVGLALVGLGLWVLWGGTGSVHVLLPERRATIGGFVVFGAMYALAATACVLPLFLALAVRSFTMGGSEALLVFGAFAGGFAALMVSVTVAIGIGYGLSAGRFASHTDRLIRVAGVVIVLAGLGQLFVATA